MCTNDSNGRNELLKEARLKVQAFTAKTLVSPGFFANARYDVFDEDEFLTNSFGIYMWAKVATEEIEQFRYPRPGIINYIRAAIRLITIRGWHPFKSLRVSWEGVRLTAVYPKIALPDEEHHLALIPKF